MMKTLRNRILAMTCWVCEEDILDRLFSADYSRARCAIQILGVRYKPVPLLTPESIKFNRFLKLILLEHKPLLACFGFLRRQKWLVSRKIN